MSFRWRLLLGLSLAVLLTASTYGLTGYVTFRNAINRTASETQTKLQQEIIASLDLSVTPPAFSPTPDLRNTLELYGNAKFRLNQNNEPRIEYGGIFPNPGADWRISTIPLNDTYTLELALNNRSNRRALASYVQTSLLALPFALGVAVLLSVLLQRVLLRPLRSLYLATNVLSRQAIPKPVQVPRGNDELTKLAQSFNRMTASLQTFIDRERGFSRYASHELRTPLSNVRLLIDGVRKGVIAESVALPQMEDSVKRIEAIISGLFTLSQPVSMTLEPVLLEPLIKDVLRRVTPANKDRVIFHTGESPIVLGQDDLIQQMITNLLNNALKYSPGKVYIFLLEHSQGVNMTIRDEGAGVPNDKLAKLTEPFFRIDPRKTGSGLGLSLVKHIAEQLRCQLRFQNLNPGFEVTVVFQRVADMHDEDLYA